MGYRLASYRRSDKEENVHSTYLAAEAQARDFLLFLPYLTVR
jgi:hypothetical protein